MTLHQEPFLLWQLDHPQHELWLASGCGTLTWPEYRRRLVAEQDRAVAAGRCVVLIRARVAEVLTEFPLNSMRFTSAGCEVA